MRFNKGPQHCVDPGLVTSALGAEEVQHVAIDPECDRSLRLDGRRAVRGPEAARELGNVGKIDGCLVEALCLLRRQARQMRRIECELRRGGLFAHGDWPCVLR